MSAFGNALRDIARRLARALRQRMHAAFPLGFDEWCATEPPNPNQARLELPSYLASVLQKPGANADTLKEGLAAIVTAAKGYDTVTITQAVTFQEFDLVFPKTVRSFSENRQQADVRQLNLVNCRRASVKHAWIQRVEISDVHEGIEFADCAISHLRFSSNVGAVSIRDCWIGTIDFHGNPLPDFAIRGGGALNIKSRPLPAKGPPFSGSVVIDQDTVFATSRKHSKVFKGAQSFRNLRAHLESLDNVPAANLMRALQLRSEREDDRGLSRFLSWCYGTFSDYGSRPGRPLWWALGLYLAAFAYIFVFDHGVAGLAIDGDYYRDARQAFIDPSYGRLVRSLVLPLQSILSPFGFLDARKAIVETTVLGTIMLAVQSIGTLALLFLSGLAVRRRFKIS